MNGMFPLAAVSVQQIEDGVSGYKPIKSGLLGCFEISSVSSRRDVVCEVDQMSGGVRSQRFGHIPQVMVPNAVQDVSIADEIRH